MSEIIPGPDTGGVKSLKVTIPSLTDNADIQEAFKKFVYGTTSIPADVTSIDTDSLAGYLYDTRSVALNAAAGTLSVTLLGTTDLNTVTSTGFSFQSSDSNATSGRNYPSFLVDAVETRYGGFLFTMSKNNSYIQEYSTVSSAADSSEALFASVRTFFRSGKILGGGSTAWSAWREVSDSTHNHDTRYYLKTEIDTKLSTKLELVSSSAIAADRVVITNANNLATTSSVTTTELGYLAGVTANIQTQINNHSQSYTTIKSNNIGANRILLTSSSDSAITVIPTPTVDKYLKYTSGGFTWADATSTSTGVTSVSGTSPVVSSGGTAPAISLATGYGDTKNPYGSKTAKYVLAAPTAANGVPDFRQLVPADIGLPKIAAGTTSVSGTGTNNTTQLVNFSSLTPVPSFTSVTAIILTSANNAVNASIESFTSSSMTIGIKNTTDSGVLNGSFVIHYLIIGT